MRGSLYVPAGTERVATARVLVAVLYLGWFAQGVVLQKAFDYVQVPMLLLAMAVVATHRWAFGFACALRRLRVATSAKSFSLEWDRLVVGHARAHNPKGWGTKDDVRALKAYMTDLSDAVRQAAGQGKCFDAAMKEVKLPKYEKWGNYEPFLPGNIERFCEYWGRGY